MVITVTGTEALTRRMLEIGQDAPKANARAVNKTLSTLKTATVRALAGELGLRNKDITPAIALQRATYGRQIGTLTVTGKRMPLIAFGARQTKAGVSYRLPGGRGLIPSGFIATMRSGHTGVFARRTKRRLPIVEQFGPSLPGAFVKAGLLTAMQARAETALETNLTHEIDWIIQQRVEAGDE
jgi:hypothetical protein